MGFGGGSKRVLVCCNCPECIWAKVVYISGDHGDCAGESAYRGLYELVYNMIALEG